eukprot:6974551-Prymnesium_polylepis.1
MAHAICGHPSSTSSRARAPVCACRRAPWPVRPCGVSREGRVAVERAARARHAGRAAAAGVRVRGPLALAVAVGWRSEFPDHG